MGLFRLSRKLLSDGTIRSMRDFLLFLKAVAKHWGIAVTSGAIIGLVGIYQGTGHRVAPRVYWIIAAVGLFLAFYRSWLEQHQKIAIETSTPASQNTNRNIANPIQTVSPSIDASQRVEQHFHLLGSSDRERPAATRPERLCHNVKYVGTRTSAADSDNPKALLACFQNEPIPHLPLATFSRAKVKIAFYRGNGEALGEVFPAIWTEGHGSKETTIDLEAGKTYCAVIAAYTQGEWRACQRKMVGTSRGAPVYEVEQEPLPMGENVHAVVTLLGERNISIDPVTLVLKLSPNGTADFDRI
jgi:hypothetical protein